MWLSLVFSDNDITAAGITVDSSVTDNIPVSDITVDGYCGTVGYQTDYLAVQSGIIADIEISAVCRYNSCFYRTRRNKWYSEVIS